MKIIAIVSGKGGVGKTTTTANLGAALAHLVKKKVVVIDANFITPNLGWHLGVNKYKSTFLEVLQGKVQISQAIHAHRSGAGLIPSTPSSYTIRSASDTIRRVLEELKGYDMILIDTTPGVESEVFPVMDISDGILVVTNPEPTAVADCHRTLKIADRVGAHVIGIVLNRVRREKYELSVEEVESVCGASVVAIIPERKEVRRSIVVGNPVVLNSPHSPAAVEFKKLAASLAGKKYRMKFADKIRLILTFKWRKVELKEPKIPVEKQIKEMAIEVTPPPPAVAIPEVPKTKKKEDGRKSSTAKEIEELLATLKEQYETGMLPENTYMNLKGANEKKLKELRRT